MKTISTVKKSDPSKQNIVFIDSTSSFNTIEDVLQLPQFKKKIVYIDLWATTCVPCIREFSKEKLVQEKYKERPVEFLYICYNMHDTANDLWRKKWKSLVNRYKLRGTHMFMFIQPPNKIIHQVINKDFYEKLDDKPLMYGIPYYMIGKDEKIIIYSAFRPSDGSKLYKQIDSLIQ